MKAASIEAVDSQPPGPQTQPSAALRSKACANATAASPVGPSRSGLGLVPGPARLRTWGPALVMAALALASLTVGCQGPGPDASYRDYEEQLRAEARARATDPNWKPATRRVAVIQAGDKGDPSNAVHNFCLHTNGHLLVCWGNRSAAAKDPAACIRVLSPEGKLVATWPAPSTPEAICVAPDGTVYVGGGGQVHKLDAQGKLLASVETPVASQAVALSKEALQKALGRNFSEADAARQREYVARRKRAVTGIAVSGSDLFVACPSVSDFGYAVWRMDRDLKNPVQLVKGLSGCCGQMDIQAKDGKLWVAHNAKHRVECYDREGKLVRSFGRFDRKAADGFGGCCEPKNLRLASDGNVYAAESGPPVTLKRFSPQGKFGGVVALPEFSSGCVRVTIEVSADCQRFYILEPGANAIQVFAAKG